MRRVKKRIWSGDVLEQEVYLAAEGGRAIDAPKRIRFKDDDERRAHRDRQQLREFTRWVNTNFSDNDYYVTMTFDDEHEVHTFEEAKRIRLNFARRLSRRFPDAVFCAFLGRGESTRRIHMHMIISGIGDDCGEAEKVLAGVWGQGRILRVEKLRKRSVLRNGEVVGKDYSGLAFYLWRHWTPEQGGHHCFKTRNGKSCEREDAVDCRRVYSEDKPPMTPDAPEGFRWAMAEYSETKFGYQYWKFVLTPTDGREKKQ